MTLDEQITILEHNAEYERTHGNLQGCLDFRQLAEWLTELKKLKEQPEPCKDCISRQRALDTFGLSEKSRKYGGDHSGYDTIMLYEVQDALEALPSVQPEQRWIPVSERSPEKDGRYLVSIIFDRVEFRPLKRYEDFLVGSAIYENETWRCFIPLFYGDSINFEDWEIIAWMPLQKTYKPHESEDTEC